MAKKHQHIFIKDIVKANKYRQSAKQATPPTIPSRNRYFHSQKLLSQFKQIWSEKESIKQSREAEVIPTRNGTYLEFTSGINADLITKSLESIPKGIRLLNIREVSLSDQQKQTRATVYIPNGLEGFFIKKVDDYEKKNTNQNKPKNAPLVESIEDISIALLESLWTDKPELIPMNNPKWCEVWLNVSTDQKQISQQIDSFFKILNDCNIIYKINSIIFPERAVILINANKDSLIEVMLRSDLLAEFRAGQEAAGFWINEKSFEQQQWVEDLVNRLEIDPNIKVKVCILDTGVNNGHQLLVPILSNNDMLTVEATWGTNDHHAGSMSGHGTMMAGIAGYGNLEKALSDSSTISITHELCSVKILPPPSQTGTIQELWGALTSQGVSRAEIQNPEKTLLFCMAVTSKDDVVRGRPSSWSGTIDLLSFGLDENKRMIIISAGNIGDDYWISYPDSNIASSIDNPAQSWNALTIGAYTEKIFVNDPTFNGHVPLAPSGGLSPYSTTSSVWEKKWPVKPDVVFEGGNLLVAPDKSIIGHKDLDLLSTSKSFNTKPFDTFSATSAATAQASWFAAKVSSEYVDAWPETIRGLIVNSAEWTQTMFNQFSFGNNKTDIGNLMKIFGYGIPNLEKALYSSESSLSMIAQEYIQPFILDNGIPSLNEMHFYRLPWPKDELLNLGNLEVKLKITLSYFIEPGAGEIGWKDRYRYQSHGLRFDLNNIGEIEAEFKKRINIAARAEGEIVQNNSGSGRWTIGASNRNFGSLHSDIWTGTAAELSTCNLICVFPIIGWWRERKHLNKVESKTRYSLIVSLETKKQDVELYTTIQNMIKVPIEVKVTN